MSSSSSAKKPFDPKAPCVIHVFPDADDNGIRFEANRSKPPKFNPDEPAFTREDIGTFLSPKPGERTFTIPFDMVRTIVEMARLGGELSEIARKAVEEIYNGKTEADDEVVRLPDAVFPTDEQVDTVYAAYRAQVDAYTARASDEGISDDFASRKATASAINKDLVATLKECEGVKVVTPPRAAGTPYDPTNKDCPACVAATTAAQLLAEADITSEDPSGFRVRGELASKQVLIGAAINSDGLYDFAVGPQEIHDLVKRGGKTVLTTLAVVAALQEGLDNGYGIATSYFIGALVGDCDAHKVPSGEPMMYGALVPVPEKQLDAGLIGYRFVARFHEGKTAEVPELLSRIPGSSEGTRILRVPARMVQEFSEVVGKKWFFPAVVAGLPKLYDWAKEPSAYLASASANG